MKNEEFIRIVTYVKDKYGIELSKKKEIVYGKLQNYIRNNGYKSFNEYMNAVEADSSGALEKKLVDMLTTNHTFFMREFEHFDFCKTVVLPYLRRKEKEKKDLAIWCAAASSGEEPYTIAMLLDDFFGYEHKDWDTQILATDVSVKVLQHAVKGIYKKEQVEPLPDQWKRKYFHPLPGGENVVVTDELKKQVIFRQFNLMEPFTFRRKMHIVFLRNVMIYFDTETKREIVKKVYDAMEPGGYLFIGRTETLDRTVAPFDVVQPSVFRKKEV